MICAHVACIGCFFYAILYFSFSFEKIGRLGYGFTEYKLV
jgi:hypothetical protein